MDISVYSTKLCPNCKILKQLLEKENLQYKDVDMATPIGLTELRMNNIFTMSAPVLQIENKFYTTRDFCIGDTLDQNMVREIIKNEIQEGDISI